MKNIKAIVLILGFLGLGVLGYYLHTSLQKLDHEETEYDFGLTEELHTDFEDIDTLNELELSIDSKVDDLELLDFETDQVEAELPVDVETELENITSEEENLEQELTDLEALDF